MNKKFKESYNMLRRSVKGTNSSIMWTAGEVDEMSYVECWIVEGKGIVIFQVLPKGVGFNEYITLTNTEKNASRLLGMVKTLIMHMKTHPDCTEGSEFEQLTGDAQELIEQTTGVKLKKV